ncbi:MAG: hypothetical protein KJO79_10850 [Verrucomicrobiae bacterium]|nr:hypothetical protein [Verrucomicrobiae bacterium]NNJ87672.1 hypothetical protein [Akkermansiaceae bacterium]
MWIELPYLWIALINMVGIPVCHLGIAWWSTRLPKRLFSMQEPRDTAKSLTVYEDIFRIRGWKHLLPDAAPWFDGFPKGSMQSTDQAYLEEFMQETRRGEFSHWVQLIAIACFILWTPWPYAIIIVVYSIISNIPCILNLRYTRFRMLAFILKKHKKQHA